jgi:hypothetical protein
MHNCNLKSVNGFSKNILRTSYDHSYSFYAVHARDNKVVSNPYDAKVLLFHFPSQEILKKFCEVYNPSISANILK